MRKATIHKRNEFVRGTDVFSLKAKRAMNAIYWVYQRHNLFKYDQINIRFSTMREIMNLAKNNDYVDEIKNALIELKKPIELNHFYHPIDEKEYQWYMTSFINSAGFSKDESGEWVVTIEIANLTKYIMQKPGNFTRLDLIPYLNKFRTKYAMKLYEYLKSFSGYSYLDITQKHMIKLLGIDEKSSYKNYSDLKRLVVRQLAEIAENSDLKHTKLIKNKLLAKEKKFRIIVDPKSKKKVKEAEAKAELENLVKRF